MKTAMLCEPVYQSELLLMWECSEPEAMQHFIGEYRRLGYEGSTLARDITTAEQDHPFNQEEMMQGPAQHDVACCYTPSVGRIHGMWIAPQKNNDDIEFVSMIAHECDHIATAVLCNIGIEHRLGDDEPHAYFLQYLVRSVLRSLKP